MNFFSAIIITIAISCNSTAQKTNLTVEEFKNGLKNEKAQILDVRSLEEYNSGHIQNAFLANWNIESQFIERINHLDKNKPVYTYCLSGIRSASATRWLLKNGFKEAYNLDGGISAWLRAGLDLEGKKEVKQISLQEYESKISSSNKTVLVDFGAIWCPPCKKMEPVLDSLVKTNGNQFDLIKIDGGEQIDITNLMQVEAFPTFIMYKNGKEVWRKQGIISKEEFIKNL